MKRKNVSEAEANKRANVMNKAFPDALVDFFTDIIDINQEVSVQVFRKLVLNKKNPPYDEYEVLEIFRNNGLKDTTDYIHALI